MNSRKVTMTEDEIRAIVHDTVQETLTLIGIRHEDPTEMQRDFAHLRDWRQAVDGAKSKTAMALAGVLISGLLGALWLGIKVMLQK